MRYIPVPTGNSSFSISYRVSWAVYPCTYRELKFLKYDKVAKNGISLYLQGTLFHRHPYRPFHRYIPVPTGNSLFVQVLVGVRTVYPCTYRELTLRIIGKWLGIGISLYLQGTHKTFLLLMPRIRYIPVPTGNSFKIVDSGVGYTVYPCTYRELKMARAFFKHSHGISLYLQGTQILSSSSDI